MMGKSTTFTLQLQHYRLQQLLQGCCFMLVLLFGAYLYFLSASIVHVVIREDVEQSTQKLRSEIALLESSYMSAQHEVSAKISTFEGYDEITQKVFIDRSAPALVMNN